MKKQRKSLLIDYNEFKISEEKCSNNFTTITIAKKKNSPYQSYIFKTFNFDCKTIKEQNIVLETFYQISRQKNQYIQNYKYLSTLSFNSEMHPTISMKYIPSITLDNLLNNIELKIQWSISEALHCLFAVAEGVCYLHDHIISHGNLCPSNIIIDKAQQCYITDFGLNAIKNLYMQPDDMANKEYRAPELDTKYPSEKSDVYSYGVLMCQLGIEFFRLNNKEKLQEFLVKNDKDKLNFLPPYLSDLIPKCLDIDPQKRPSFHDIQNHFQDPKYPLNDMYKKFLNTNYIVKLAQLDDSFALNKLGEMYEDGKGVDEDHDRAMYCFERAALLGNSKAQANYGVLLQDGSDNSPDNLSKGAKFLKMSADHGDVHGMANYGIALMNGEGVEQNFKKANEYLKKAADLGYSFAQVEYGYNLISTGKPTKDQIKQALRYIKKAINQGDRNGFYTYGLLLQLGDGIMKNEKLACEYFKEAADDGDVRAMVEYAKAKYNLIPPNYEESFKYFTMAYEKGVFEVRPNIEQLAKQLNLQYKFQIDEKASKKIKNKTKSKKPFKPNTKNQNKEQKANDKEDSEQSDTIINIKIPDKAKVPHFDYKTPSDELISIYNNLKNEYLELQQIGLKTKTISRDISHFRVFQYEDQFIQTNNAIIIYKYGKLYENISSAKIFRDKAMNYYKLSADKDYSKAQVKYGIALQDGKDVKKNLKLGAFYLEKAALQGNIEGMHHYGLALLNGDGVQLDKELGLKFLKDSADKNYAPSQFSYGRNVDDENVGHRYIELAAKANYEEAIYYYGKDLLKGKGCQKDHKKASEIFLNLYSKEKNIRTLSMLIDSLKHIDKKEFIKYLKILADKNGEDDNIHKARLRYGIKLFYGDDGLTKNEEEALMYIKKSKYIDKIKKRKYPEIYAKFDHDFSSVKSDVDSFLNRNNGIIDPTEEKIVQGAYNGNIDDMLQTAKMINKTGDTKTANFFFILAADSNQMEACYIIGKFYLKGMNGLQTDTDKGTDYINKSINLGYPEAQYFRTIYQMKEAINDKLCDDAVFDEIFDELCEIADENYIPAMILKAKCLLKRNPKEAKKELEKVLIEAPNDFHVLYKVGKILLISINDLKKFAIQLLELSSKYEDKAAFLLGQYYYGKRRESVDNFQKAMTYLRKAVDKKVKNSQKIYDDCKLEFEKLKQDGYLAYSEQQKQKKDEDIDLINPPKVNSAEILNEFEKNPRKIFSIKTILALQQVSDQQEPKPDLESDSEQESESRKKQEQDSDSESYFEPILKSKPKPMKRKEQDSDSESDFESILKSKPKPMKKQEQDSDSESYFESILKSKPKPMKKKEQDSDSESYFEPILKSKPKSKPRKKQEQDSDSESYFEPILKSKPKPMKKKEQDSDSESDFESILKSKPKPMKKQEQDSDSESDYEPIPIPKPRKKQEQDSDIEFDYEPIPKSRKKQEQDSDLEPDPEPDSKPMKEKEPVVEYFNLNLPSDELIRKGEEYQSQKLFIDAFQYFEAAALKGDPYAYFKCAEVCDDFEKKLQFYEIAIMNNIKGAFQGWRKSILEYIEKNKNEIPTYAQKFVEKNDFSDAAILYQQNKQNEKSEECFQKAIENIKSIQYGEQQYDFGIFLMQRNEIELAFDMFKKSLENGIFKSEKRISELKRIKSMQLKKLSPAESLLEQGISYFEGKNGATVDMDKALSFLTRSSEEGCPKADFYLGKYCKKIGNLSLAIYYFRKSCDEEDSDGQNGFGDCLRMGIGIEKDLNKAIEYYKLSADQGNMYGEYNYGREIFMNSSSNEEKEIGIRYLKKAVEKGLPDAMYYYSKAISSSNPEESQKYFEKSLQESEIAVEKYGKELEEQNRHDESAKLYKSAAQNGLMIGYKKYAEYIIKDLAVDEDDDLSLARQYLKKVADEGDAEDQFNYAEFLYGYLPDESIEMAKYYKLSTQKDFPKAFYRYAECLKDGKGVPKDIDEARKYFTLSYKNDPESPTRFIFDKLQKQGLIDC